MKKNRWPIIIAGSVLGLWIITLLAGLVIFDSWTTRGQFGDLFGSVNALFSGFAFAGLLYAIFLQRQELGLQREELQLQREEMRASRAELAEQVAAQKALYNANVAQIQVAAEQARIEAVTIVSDLTSDRREFVKQINELANKIEKISTDLKNG